MDMLSMGKIGYYNVACTQTMNRKIDFMEHKIFLNNYFLSLSVWKYSYIWHK